VEILIFGYVAITREMRTSTDDKTKDARKLLILSPAITTIPKCKIVKSPRNTNTFHLFSIQVTVNA